MQTPGFEPGGLHRFQRVASSGFRGTWPTHRHCPYSLGPALSGPWIPDHFVRKWPFCSGLSEGFVYA